MNILIVNGSTPHGTILILSILEAHPDYSISTLDELRGGDIQNFSIFENDKKNPIFLFGKISDMKLTEKIVEGKDLVIHVPQYDTIDESNAEIISRITRRKNVEFVDLGKERK